MDKNDMRSYELAFVDLEMTGLDPLIHEVIEVGIVIAKQTRTPDGRWTIEAVAEREIALRPEHIENADPKGLEINHFHTRDWSHAVSQKEGLTEVAEILEGKVYVGQNMSLDWAFLFNEGKKHGLAMDTKVHYHKLDLASMAFGKLYHEPELAKFSLQEMCDHFGVKNDEAHTALSDARATYEVCKKLLEM